MSAAPGSGILRQCVTRCTRPDVHLPPSVPQGRHNQEPGARAANAPLEATPCSSGAGPGSTPTKSPRTTPPAVVGADAPDTGVRSATPLEEPSRAWTHPHTVVLVRTASGL